jgi:hypothetical protein
MYVRLLGDYQWMTLLLHDESGIPLIVVFVFVLFFVLEYLPFDDIFSLFMLDESLIVIQINPDILLH